MTFRRLLPLPCLLALACDAGWHTVDAVIAPARPGQGSRCELRYVDEQQQTLLGPGDRSHWLQPWRAYQDTFPARRMREALGMIDAPNERFTRLLAVAASRIPRLRTTLTWADADFDTPDRLAPAARAAAREWFTALRTRGLRPHVVLQAPHGRPAPTRTFAIRLVEPAPPGARQIKIDPAALPQIVPGYTGLTVADRTPGLFFTQAAADGTVTLSRALPAARPAGTQDAHTLRFRPFAHPVRPDGTPSPAFEETMRGWEQFLAAVTTEVKAALGSDAFDVEIWDDVSTASGFLGVNNYYDTPVDQGSGPPYEEVSRAILARSVAFFRAPANGLAGVRVVSGFSTTRYTDAGSTLVSGAAMGRRVAVGGGAFPGQPPDPARSLRADGKPNGSAGPDGRWQEEFTPRYVAGFPELALVPLFPPRVIFPDLSPLQSFDPAGNAHGRDTRAPGGAAVPVVVSSFQFAPRSEFFALTEGRVRREVLWRFKQKVALRAAAAYVGKGAETLFLEPSFDTHGDFYEDDQPATGGLVYLALERFLAAFTGPATIGQPRALRLETVAACDQGRQFEGNGTAAYPPLFDGEVVAFFPFQADDNRFVVPVYVMTRDMGRLYRPQAADNDVTRHDMPPQTFTLTIGGVRSAAARVQIMDPLTGATTALMPTEIAGGKMVIDVPLTDWPRLLLVTDS